MPVSRFVGLGREGRTEVGELSGLAAKRINGGRGARGQPLTLVASRLDLSREGRER
jgi:hypothetical protein